MFVCLRFNDFIALKETVSNFNDGYFRVFSLFYQLITFYTFDTKHNIYLPFLHALVDSKEESCYDNMFDEVNFLLMKISNQLKTEYNIKTEFLMLNYEMGLVNSAKRNITIDN